MLQGQSFKKVLRDTLNKEENSGFQSHFQSQDPAHLAYLMGQIPQYKFQNQRPKAYKSTAFHSTAAPQTETEVVVWSFPENFNEAQKQAFLSLKELGADIGMHFSRGDLKRVFRQLALKTHPDHGGSTEAFLRLKNLLHCLESLAL